MIWLALQDGLTVIGGGTAAIVYEVNENVVLKGCRTYEPPARDASCRDWWNYADSTLFTLDVGRKEKDIFRRLEKQPHPNIVEAISFEDEGIYLRRYLPLSQVELPTQEGRVLWYQDILRGLEHLHGLGICHSDLRTDNILFSRGRHPRALLCDFNVASAFGELNASSRVGDPVPRTGLARTLSDVTDRFGLAYLIFEMETGSKPTLTTMPDGTCSLPLVCTGHGGLDSMIYKAWRGQYASTSDMLADAVSLSVPVEQNGDARPTAEPLVPAARLRQQVKQWRQRRLDRHGKCILFRSASYTTDTP